MILLEYQNIKTILQKSMFQIGLKKLLWKVKVELDLSNYATKADLKNAKDLDISNFAKEVDLANLKCTN